MGRVVYLDLRGESDEKKYAKYEEIEALYNQGKNVVTREHKSGFPTITIDCEDIHIITDCLSAEAWRKVHPKKVKEV